MKSQTRIGRAALDGQIQHGRCEIRDADLYEKFLQDYVVAGARQGNENRKELMMNLGVLMGMRPLSGSFVGELAELLVFTQALSKAERQQVETYLMDKYGLSDKHANVSR